MGKRVLVLGGGFGALESAIWLRKYGFDVTVVTNRDYMYIYPISIWIPTGEYSFEDCTISWEELRKVHGFEVKYDKVTKIDINAKKIVCEKETFSDFDYLVIAIGADKVKHKGSENFLSICGAPEESLKIKEKLDELIKKGEGKLAFGFGGNPKDPSNVRGGPAFEVMFNVHNKLKKLGIRNKFEITFFAPMPKPGARMGEKALKVMDMWFNKLDIKQIKGKKIKEFVSDGVIFEDDSKLESDLTMFIPAGNGLEIFKDSGLPLNEAGFIKINEYCEVMHNFDETSSDKFPIFAVGDSAAIDGPDWRAKQGHLAEVMAKVTAYNIKMMEEGKESRKEYISHINILCLMDSGDGGAFVYRDNKKAMLIPLPIIGHWMKKGWGWYFKNSKLNKIPRIPGM
ncbi:MAG: FAD-dependent oxidoreductase [Nautiliaceae bacterium]